MKILLRVIPLTLLLFTFCSTDRSTKEIKVITFNIRFDNPADAPNHWSNRIPIIANYLQEEMPDIMGVQEALYHQNEDILNMVPGYSYLGTGRDDGERGGEYSPVFYRTDKFELLEHSQFWLSETPDIPGSIGWEAILPRVVSWARLKHKGSGSELYVFNTHFSHVSDLARRKSMEFLSENMLEIAGNEPIILTGDFNIRNDSELYTYMIQHLQTQNALRNAQYLSVETVSDVASTFNGFREDSTPAVIDFIFVNDHFAVKRYEVDKVKQDDIFISDHWPVKVVLTFK